MVLDDINQLINYGLRSGFEILKIGEVSGYPLIALNRRSPASAPHIVVSSGIHGDEPASVHAIITLLKSGFFNDDFNWSLAPLLNPTGFAAQSRGNIDGIDLNRDFLHPKTTEIQSYTRFLDTIAPIDLSIAIHEDLEATGYYIFAIGGDTAESMASDALKAVSKIGPIETEPMIDDHPASNGLIIPMEHLDLSSMDEWPEAVYMSQEMSALNLTLESPSALPLNRRIPMHTSAIKTALSRYNNAGGNRTMNKNASKRVL